MSFLGRHPRALCWVTLGAFPVLPFPWTAQCLHFPCTFFLALDTEAVPPLPLFVLAPRILW